MKRRTPTDNSRALAHLLHNRPGLKIVSSGCVLEWTSTCITDPTCQKLPGRDEIDAMVADDMVEYYWLTTVQSDSPFVPGFFDKSAVWKTADHFGRSSDQVRNILRKAGYGRGKVTARSS